MTHSFSWRLAIRLSQSSRMSSVDPSLFKSSSTISCLLIVCVRDFLGNTFFSSLTILHKFSRFILSSLPTSAICRWILKKVNCLIQCTLVYIRNILWEISIHLFVRNVGSYNTYYIVAHYKNGCLFSFRLNLTRLLTDFKTPFGCHMNTYSLLFERLLPANRTQRIDI